jgi:membrane protease subunit (stomatin/prohibitin family)
MFDGIKRQLRSVIQWENPGEDALFHRWTENGDEIKNASKLIVNPGQGCIFVYQGKVEAVIDQEGMTDLKTDNIPFWTTITKFMQAFQSEHKVGIYFYKKVTILNQKWGTSSIIKYEDPKYKFPVGLKAYGNYSMRITDPKGFFVNVVGGAPDYKIDNFREVMGARIVQPMTDYFAEAKLGYTDIDAQREEMSTGISKKLTAVFGDLGFEITDFRIEGTSFDEPTMNRINRIGDVTAEAEAAKAAGLNYAQMQQLGAMRDAAKNEGGGAGIGMGLGAGMGMGNMMAGAMAGGFGSQNAEDPAEKLQKLKKMLADDLITKEEYETKKKEILDKM